MMSYGAFKLASAKQNKITVFLRLKVQKLRPKMCMKLWIHGSTIEFDLETPNFITSLLRLSSISVPLG